MTHNQKSGISPIGAVVTGAIVGAGVVAAGMAINSDKGKEKIQDAKDMVKDKVEELREKSTNAASMVKDSIEDTVENIKHEIKK